MIITTTTEEMADFILTTIGVPNREKTLEQLNAYFGKASFETVENVSSESKPPQMNKNHQRYYIRSLRMAEQYPEIERIVSYYIKQQFEQGLTPIKLGIDDNLSDKFAADELDIVEIVMGIEEQLDIDMFDIEKTPIPKLTPKHFCDCVFKEIQKG